jgi:alkylation response protein AidB-like acyl-CoA dehydrogenase
MMSRLAGLDSGMCEMILDTLRQVAVRRLPDEKVLQLDRDNTFPEELIRELLSPDVGLHLIFLPEDVGGMGGGARDICRVAEEMASIDLGVATAFLSISLGTEPILVAGTPEQKSKWLGRIAEGLIVAYAVTEPARTSSPAPSSSSPTAGWPRSTPSWPGHRAVRVSSSSSVGPRGSRLVSTRTSTASVRPTPRP